MGSLGKSLKELYDFFIESYKNKEITYDEMREKIKENFLTGEIESKMNRNIMLNVLKKATINYFSESIVVLTEKETVEFLNDYYDINSN